MPIATSMTMQSKKRALDKIYKRRDRYDIPDWQRGEVWDTNKKQQLIDSILRGWKLPKFYFLKTSEDPEEFEVVDGQQRLVAIFDFFDNQLVLSPSSAKEFGGKYYKDLPTAASDEFDDFEIEYDEISDATEQEIKDFFQRLQQGLPLTSSEKLNSVHSNLRNFCRVLAKHDFFKKKAAFADKRYAYFDVAAKAAVIEIEGLEAGLRFDEMKALFESQASFSENSAAAKRLKATLDYLVSVFSAKTAQLRNRSIVQSIITLATKLVSTGKAEGHQSEFRAFVKDFMAELAKQVELGLNATDSDYLEFQRSVNANVRAGAQIRHRILLRKMFRTRPALAAVFDSSTLAESGISSDVRRLGDSLAELINKANAAYSAKHGSDLFKPTNKTVAALKRVQKPISDYSAYRDFVADLYFLVWEGTGQRLKPSSPQSFKDVNALRTDLEHDVDHGKKKDVAAKRKSLSGAFNKYVGATTPRTLAPEQFVVFQANLLTALEKDLQALIPAI